MGTDPNRNFDFQWATVGSSDQPCSDTYHGSEPFSEVETRNVRDFVLPRKDQLKHFIDVHSYSQIVITPWGYTSEVPDDWDEVRRLTTRLSISFCVFTFGNHFKRDLFLTNWPCHLLPKQVPA